jgi:hypothetical protein
MSTNIYDVLLGLVDFVCSRPQRRVRQETPDEQSLYLPSNPHPVEHSRCQRQALALPAHTSLRHKTILSTDRRVAVRLTRREFPSTQKLLPFAFCSKVPARVTTVDVFPCKSIDCWSPGPSFKVLCWVCITSPGRTTGMLAAG